VGEEHVGKVAVEGGIEPVVKVDKCSSVGTAVLQLALEDGNLTGLADAKELL